MSDLELAENLMHTCYEMYRQTPTGLAPEIVFFLGQEKDFPKAHLVGHPFFGDRLVTAHTISPVATTATITVLIFCVLAMPMAGLPRAGYFTPCCSELFCDNV